RHVERGILIDLLIVDGRRETDQQFIPIVIERLPRVLVAERDAGLTDGWVTLPIDIHAHRYFFLLMFKPDGLCKRVLADKTVDRYLEHQWSVLHYPYPGGLVGTG